MKFSASACFLFTLISLGSLTQAQTCDKTKGALKLLETWQTGTVVLTNKPASGDWTMCKNTYGSAMKSCCDPTNLKLSFKKMAEGVKMSWDMFLADVAKFKMNAAKLKAAAGGANIMTQAEMYKDRLKGLTAAQAKAIVDRLDAIDAYITMLKSKASPCFTASLVARSNLICAACIESADVTTDAGMHNIFKYKAMSCNSLTEACYPIWDYMLKLQATTLIAHEIRRGSGGAAPKGSPDLPASMTFGSLYTLNAKCTSGKVDTATMCTQADIDNICATNLNLYKAEPTGMGVNGTDFSAASARLLAGHTIEGFGSVAATGGVDLVLETMALDTSVMVDASKVGGDSASTNTNTMKSGNILMLSFLGLVVAAIAH